MRFGELATLEAVMTELYEIEIRSLKLQIKVLCYLLSLAIVALFILGIVK